MSKDKSKVLVEGNTISGTAQDIINKLQEATDSLNDDLDEIDKPFQIMSASIKDEVCEYGYEVLTGPQQGSKIPKCKGSFNVHEDMIAAFQQLDIHLAESEDAFEYVLDPKVSLSELMEHEIASKFSVGGFRISGTNENEGYILIGHKAVKVGHMVIESEKLQKNNYRFFEDLKESIGWAVNEVEEYMNGKTATTYVQSSIPFPDSLPGLNEDFLAK